MYATMKNAMRGGLVVAACVLGTGCCESQMVALAQEASRAVAPAKGLATKAKFNKIKSKMSYKEVVSIIGEEGDEMSRVEIPGVPVTVMYTWKGQGSVMANMNAMFQDDKLISKAQFCLE